MLKKYIENVVPGEYLTYDQSLISILDDKVISTLLKGNQKDLDTKYGVNTKDDYSANFNLH